MLRAPPKTARLEPGSEFAGAALLSAAVHAAVLLALTLNFSFPAPAPGVDTLEVELIVVEPEVDEASAEEQTPDDTPQDPQDVRDEEAERQVHTTARLPKTAESASRSSTPGSSQAAETNSAPDDVEPQAAAEKEYPEPPRPKPEPEQPDQLANLADEEKSLLREAMVLGEELGCDAPGRPASTGIAIDRMAKSAKSGRSYAQSAVHAQISGHYREAIDLYDAAIRSRDLSRADLAKVYNNRGAAYRSLGFRGLAIDDYNEAMRLKPDYAAAYFNRGIAHSLGDENEHAIADFSRSIQLDSGLAEPFYHRGAVYARQARYELAIADFSRAITLAPCLDYAYFDRGRVYETTGDLERAIDDFKRSYALDPNNQDYRAKLLNSSSP